MSDSTTNSTTNSTFTVPTEGVFEITTIIYIPNQPIIYQNEHVVRPIIYTPQDPPQDPPQNH
jgi:hypothetical protein